MAGAFVRWDTSASNTPRSMGTIVTNMVPSFRSVPPRTYLTRALDLQAAENPHLAAILRQCPILSHHELVALFTQVVYCNPIDRLSSSHSIAPSSIFPATTTFDIETRRQRWWRDCSSQEDPTRQLCLGTSASSSKQLWFWSGASTRIAPLLST